MSKFRWVSFGGGGWGVLAGLVINTAVSTSALAYDADYTVEPNGSLVRGNLWIGEGLAGVYSSNRSVGNRLRAGGEIQLGSDYQFILGVVFLDHLWSGETSASVGDVSRDTTSFEAGYFFIPDKLWGMYSLGLDNITGSAVIGNVHTVDHQLSVGYRFFSDGAFSLAVEGAYSFAPSYTAETLDYTSNTFGVASFPQASVWSLNLRVGWDVGGR